MFAVLYTLISNAAILCCFVPAVLLLVRRMRQVTTFRVLGLYWLLNGLVHFSDLYVFYSFRNSPLDQFTEYYNLVDTPLVLVVFSCAASGFHKRLLLLTSLAVVIGECVLVAWKGYSFTLGFLFTGSGVLLVLAYCIAGLVQYMRKMEYTSFENSMVFVYASLLFGYGSFMIISFFLHIRGNSEGNSRDSYLLYYISLLLSATITSLGLWSYGVRRRRQEAFV